MHSVDELEATEDPVITPPCPSSLVVLHEHFCSPMLPMLHRQFILAPLPPLCIEHIRREFHLSLAFCILSPYLASPLFFLSDPFPGPPQILQNGGSKETRDSLP